MIAITLSDPFRCVYYYLFFLSSFSAPAAASCSTLFGLTTTDKCVCVCVCASRFKLSLGGGRINVESSNLHLHRNYFLNIIWAKSTSNSNSNLNYHTHTHVYAVSYTRPAPFEINYIKIPLGNANTGEGIDGGAKMAKDMTRRHRSAALFSFRSIRLLSDAFFMYISISSGAVCFSN